MPTSRVALPTLVVALIAGLVTLHEAPPLLATLAGLALLVGLFAYDQRGARTGAQSLAFALVCGLALLCTFSYPFGLVLPAFGASATFMAQDFPALLWFVGTAAFWFIDRSRMEARQSPGLAYTQSPISQAAPSIYPVAAPQPQPLYTPPTTPVTRPITPVAPEPEPVRNWNPPAPEPQPMQAEPVYAAAPISTVAPPAAAPVPSGKEVSIYVNMLDEGMSVLRSVRAEHLGRDFYVIVDQMPDDEKWEYSPGQVVRCRKKNLSNGKGLVAYEEAPRAQ
jgi:hypothetical protein